MKKILGIMLLAAAIMVGGLIAIRPVQVEAAKAKISKSEITVEVEGRVKLKIKNTKKKVKWSSSDKTKAKVSQKGNVTGISAGECTVTAKVGKKTFTCKVTVTDTLLEKLDEVQTVRGVELRKSSSWKKADDNQSNSVYQYSLSDETYIWNWVHVVELTETERVKLEGSEERYAAISESLSKDILQGSEIKSYSSEIQKYNNSFLGKINISCIDNGNDIGVVIYTRITGNKLVIVMGMEIDELEPEVDKIIRKICISAVEKK